MALVHTDLDRETEDIVADVLGVEVSLWAKVRAVGLRVEPYCRGYVWVAWRRGEPYSRGLVPAELYPRGDGGRTLKTVVGEGYSCNQG